jgi:hypothetical protein
VPLSFQTLSDRSSANVTITGMSLGRFFWASNTSDTGLTSGNDAAEAGQRVGRALDSTRLGKGAHGG